MRCRATQAVVVHGDKYRKQIDGFRNMADSFPTCLAFTLREEGGWIDNPLDPGGATNCGITLASFRDWKQNPLLECSDLRAIGADQVHEFYYTVFWLAMEAPNLPLGPDLMLFDQAVNSGVSRSIKILQGVLDIPIDGEIGPLTLAAVLAVDPAVLVTSLTAAQIVFYQNLAEFTVFGTGWIKRVEARQIAATALMTVS